MPKWYEDVGSSIANGISDIGDGIANGFSSVGDFVGDSYAYLSGAEDIRKARDQQLQALNQGVNAVNNAYGQSQQYLGQYANPQDFQNLRAMVGSGNFMPGQSTFQQQQYSQTQAPTFSQYAAPNAPQMQQFQGQQFNRQYQEPQFNFQADPGYQFRMNEALRAVNQGNAARGMLNSSANQNQLMDRATGLASQAYNDAFSQFNTNRNFGRGVYEGDRNYSMDLNNQNFGQFANQRDFGYNAYQDQRNFGRDVYGQDRAFNQSAYQDLRNFGRDVYNQDRAFGYGMFNDQYNRNATSLNDQYSRLSDLAKMGYNASTMMSGNAIDYGNTLAGLYGNRGDTMAASILGASNANRNMLGDVVQFGKEVGSAIAGGKGGSSR